MNLYTVDNMMTLGRRKDIRTLDIFSILHPLNNLHGIVHEGHVFDCMLRMYMYIRMYAIPDGNIMIMKFGQRMSVSRKSAMDEILNMSFENLLTDWMYIVDKSWMGDEIEFEVMYAVCLSKIMQHSDIHFELAKDTHCIYLMDGSSKRLMSRGNITDEGFIGKNMFGFAMMKAFDFITGKSVRLESARMSDRPLIIRMKYDERFGALLTFCVETVADAVIGMRRPVVASKCDDGTIDLYLMVDMNGKDKETLCDALSELTGIHKILND